MRTDALVAWVAQSDARVYATDRFIFNKTTEGIALDVKQDWHVLGGSQTTNQSTGDTWTTVHVWRKLDTGDCNDRPIVPGTLHNVIWAMGATTDQAEKQPAQQAQQQESMLNFTFTNYRLPTDFTTYRCKVVDIALKAKTHAVEWGVIHNSTDNKAIHHAIIYGCKP
ncbi:unnamed protein product [Closterium sp. Naga37s-1]|nr:unnamed protein product [Closterium sp. Naga37s-1]